MLQLLLPFSKKHIKLNFLRPFIVILCTLLIGFQTCYPGLVGIYFQLNKQYIQENLCINKDLSELPELNCKGKCHLRKMIELGADGTIVDSTKSENHEKGPKLQQSAEDIVLFCQQFCPIVYHKANTTNIPDINRRSYSWPFLDLSSQIYLSAIFVPPNLA